MRIGFIGLGEMGRHIAHDLVEGHHEVTLYDISSSALDRFATSGAHLARSLSEVAAASEVIGICVVDDEQVREVVAGSNGLLNGPIEPGTVLMVHSTVHPDTIRDLAVQTTAEGGHLIDASLTAGPMSKTHIDRLVMVGADPEVYSRCAEALAAIGTPILVGPLGTGCTVKLLNNLLTTATIGTAEAVLRIGESIGLERRVLERVFLLGSATSNPLSIMVRRRDRTPHRLKMLSKDVTLAADHLNALGGDLGGIDSMAELGLAAIEADVAVEKPSVV